MDAKQIEAQLRGVKKELHAREARATPQMVEEGDASPCTFIYKHEAYRRIEEMREALREVDQELALRFTSQQQEDEAVDVDTSHISAKQLQPRPWSTS